MDSLNYLHCVAKLMSGHIYVIKMWNGFNMGNLLSKIRNIMETEHGEEEFNCERILLFNKEHEMIDFMDDDFLNNGDYFNIVIIDDDDEYEKDQIDYVNEELEGPRSNEEDLCSVLS
jgi:hypothetical protein